MNWFILKSHIQVLQKQIKVLQDYVSNKTGVNSVTDAE